MAVLQPHQIREVALTAITAVASDDLLSQRLVLKGGNALQLVYQVGTRASVDLDYSISGDMDPAELRERLDHALAERFRSAGYTVFDFACVPRPADSTTKLWGGYSATFKLVSHQDAALIEASEAERLGKKKVQAALAANADGAQRRRAKSRQMALAAAPASLSDEERLDAWRRNATQTYKIDVSKYEYVAGHERTVIRHFDCAVYSPAMIAAEKLRAICQQMPGYPARKHPTPRSRDFYDLHALATSRFKVDVAADPSLVKAMFDTKEVPLHLLGLIGQTRAYHHTNWETVVQAIAGERPEPFDFYFDFVLGEVARLQPLWQV